jgi:hypothetical protein
MADVNAALEELQQRKPSGCALHRFFQVKPLRQLLSQGDAEGWWKGVREQSDFAEIEREQLAGPLQKAGAALCRLTHEQRDQAADRFVSALLAIE